MGVQSVSNRSRSLKDELWQYLDASPLSPSFPLNNNVSGVYKRYFNALVSDTDIAMHNMSYSPRLSIVAKAPKGIVPVSSLFLLI